MPTDEEIRTRIKARECATTLAEMAKEEALQFPEAMRPVFFEEIARRLDVKLWSAPSPGVEPFTDAQARVWGKTRIQFGAHAGEQIDQIPIAYLEKLTEPNDFTRHLRRYLASHRVALEEEMAAQNGTAW